MSLTGQGRLAFVLNALSQAYDLVLLAPGPVPGESFTASLDIDVALVLHTPTSQLPKSVILGAMDRIGVKELAWLEFSPGETIEDTAAA